MELVGHELTQDYMAHGIILADEENHTDRNNTFEKEEEEEEESSSSRFSKIYDNPTNQYVIELKDGFDCKYIPVVDVDYKVRSRMTEEQATEAFKTYSKEHMKQYYIFVFYPDIYSDILATIRNARLPSACICYSYTRPHELKKFDQELEKRAKTDPYLDDLDGKVANWLVLQKEIDEGGCHLCHTCSNITGIEHEAKYQELLRHLLLKEGSPFFLYATLQERLKLQLEYLYSMKTLREALPNKIYLDRELNKILLIPVAHTIPFFAFVKEKQNSKIQQIFADSFTHGIHARDLVNRVRAKLITVQHASSCSPRLAREVVENLVGEEKSFLRCTIETFILQHLGDGFWDISEDSGFELELYKSYYFDCLMWMTCQRKEFLNRSSNNPDHIFKWGGIDLEEEEKTKLHSGFSFSSSS